MQKSLNSSNVDNIVFATPSVIIPAHNEEGVIKETLDKLLSSIPASSEVVVVVNGSIDKTYDIVKQKYPGIKVINTEVPSKTNALNLGEEHVKGYPRLYMDADIIVTPETVKILVQELTKRNVLAISPIPIMDFSSSSWFVKAYYNIWLSLPYCQSGLIGSGMYMLSENGRKRFSRFPDIISDDGFIRAQFKDNERCTSGSAIAHVKAPSNIYWLLKIKIRSRIGQFELRKKYPQLLDNEKKSYSSVLKRYLYKPGRWHELTVYIIVVIITRIIAARKVRNLDKYQWQRDMSSR